MPTHILDFLFGSLTSHTHLFPFLCRTPLYTGCRVSRNFFLPAFLLWDGLGFGGVHINGEINIELEDEEDDVSSDEVEGGDEYSFSKPMYIANYNKVVYVLVLFVIIFVRREIKIIKYEERIY